jgi:SAM-dependent methyltransferase
MAKNSQKTKQAGTDPVIADGSKSSQALIKQSTSISTTRAKREVAPDLSNSGEPERHIELEESTQQICDLTFDNRLFLAPLSAPKRVLDVATGHGIWAIDMAKANPSAEIDAFDILTVSVRTHPPNVNFKTHECGEDWPYPEDHFDLIHIRGMAGCIQNWPSVYRKALKHLRPGGYIEHLEWSLHVRSLDGRLSSNPTFSHLSDILVDAGRVLGKTYEIAENMAGLIQEAGFNGIVEKGFKWPIGAWSSGAQMREIGQINLLRWQRALETWTPSVAKGGYDVSQSDSNE